MDINDIPKTQKSNFPIGVSEHAFNTEAEAIAFTNGVNLAQDTDVETSEIFSRGTGERDCSFGFAFTFERKRWVVRVKVGNFGDNE